ncbi:MAG: DNA recombination protein RmuC [Candidatus Dojkabacteria bacterium]
MDINQLLLIVLILILIVGFIYIASKISKPPVKDDGTEKLLQMMMVQMNSESSKNQEKLDRTIKDLNDRLNDQNRTINDQMSKSQTNILQQFAMSQKNMRETSDSAAKIIKEVTEKLTKLDDTNKQVVNFAEQLQSLENILKNPKQRGVLGEYFLETVLKNVLPPNGYQMQYKFLNSEIVDAAVFVGKKIIPIDAKFSLENYNRILEAKEVGAREILEKEFKNDLKKRIDETSKYIRPEEGTMSFAFMFIPSEGIYYDLLINQVGNVKTNTHDLIEYAFKQKSVIIVSPTSFLAYLQTVLQGLNALKIEEKAIEIKENVEKLQKHIASFDMNFAKLGKNLSTVVTAYGDARSEYKKIDKDLYKITDNTIAITSEDIERPVLD